MAGRAVMSLSRSLRRFRPLTAARPPPSLRCFSAPPPPEAAPSPPSPPSAPAPEKVTGTPYTRALCFPNEDTDFEHWVVVMKHPGPNTTDDQIKQSFIDTLAQVVGSEDEARAKIYSMSLKYFISFGARIPMELSSKIGVLPTVDWVQPDSYVDEEKKVFGILDIATKDEEWERNSGRSHGDHIAERLIRSIRYLKKYKRLSGKVRWYL